MDYLERAKQAEEGIKLLNQRIFPNEILEPIKEKRLRSDLTNLIFSPKGTPNFKDLSAGEKQKRADRFQVELAFVRYMASFEAMRYAGILLLLFGLLTLFFWTLYQNGNQAHGLITLFESLALIAVSFKNQTIIKHCKTILIVFSLLFVAELIVYQLPNPFLSGTTIDWQDGRRRNVAFLFNAYSPILYLMSKAIIIGFVGKTYFRIQEFTKEKRNFEGRYY